MRVRILHVMRAYRFSTVFIAVARLRSQGRDFQEIRAEVARTIFNFNSRLQAVEDEVESKAAVLRAFELRLQRVQLAVLLLCSILLLQLLRLLL